MTTTPPADRPTPDGPAPPAVATPVPSDVLAAVAPILEDLSVDRRTTFDVRLQRWWPDLVAGLAEAWAEPAPLAHRLVVLAASAYRDRPDDLHRLDLRRLVEPDWLQSPRMVGYSAYTERFAGDLAGVRDRIGHLRELGVTYLHLMPFLRPREGEADGGYAVADYRRVREDLGTMDDVRALTRALRRDGISLVVDLVLNHVADDHDWVRRARAGEQEFRDYFHVFPDRTVPDLFEHHLPEVFPDFAPGNFTFDDDLDAWVWTTFNDYQWDVDWSNPAVVEAYGEIILFLANAGVEVVRLDAIAFLWKRMGTSCQGQPEVHGITGALRALTRIACPAVAFKAEAIVAPTDLVSYLGQGRHTGKVSDLAYHNSLMVQVWSMLATGEVGLAARALSSLPSIPSTGTWITYLRCHDDIGWAVDDADAAAVGVTGHGHRSFLSDFYAGDFPTSTARGLVFQFNPATGDRRISGTAASLVGLEDAEARGDPAAIERAVARMRLAHAVTFGWGGIPVVWSGDELGQSNDPDWADDPAHAADNRWAHRPALDPDRLVDRHDPTTVPGRVFADLQALVAARTRLPHLHAAVPSTIGEVDDPAVLVVVRQHPIGPMVQLYNVSDQHRSWPGHRAHQYGVADAVDAISGQPLTWGVHGSVVLAPHAALWLVGDA